MSPPVDCIIPPDGEAALLARCYRLILSWCEIETITPGECEHGAVAGKAESGRASGTAATAETGSKGDGK